jgi:ADP-heptose:LPS heptosyltransferase
VRILIRRTGALGDVILATPVVRQLRVWNPDADIAVQTACPDVFRDSPHRLTMLRPGPLPYPWTEEGGVYRTIDLDLAYERRPLMHVVEAYMAEAFGDPGNPGDRRQELFYRRPRNWPSNSRIVAIHAAKAGWRNRTLPEGTWKAVAAGVKAAGFTPLLVGTMRDALPQSGISAFHSGDLLVQTGVISRCACFVGSDSALLHAAGATDVPIVGVFTCVPPELRMPQRGPGFRAGTVVPDLSCVGCHVRRPTPATFESCERGDVACVGAVDPHAVVEAILRLTA